MNVNTDKFDTVMDAAAQRFVIWAFRSLGLAIEPSGESTYSCELTNGERESFGGAENISFTFARHASKQASPVEALTFGSPLFRWLIKQLTAAGKPIHAAPANQPQSVHELSPQLFDSYVLDKGNVHLSGCTLDDRPFLRLTFLEREDRASPCESLTHLFMDARGNLLEDELRNGLGLDDLAPLAAAPHRLEHVDIHRWIAAGNKLFQASGRSGARSDLVVVTIVWCKYAEGKLSFVVNEDEADVTFSGWAQLLRNGHVKPPPFVCPHSGEKSYHVSVTDDGRLTAAEAIGICAETGQRVLNVELETCEATGNSALEERFATCPVTQKRVLRSALVACSDCRQEVSPVALTGTQCQACKDVKLTSKDDPCLARLLGEYPQLDQWKRWYASETDEVYVLRAIGLTKQLLLVVMKDSLEVVRMARRGHFGKVWSDLAANEREDLLR